MKKSSLITLLLLSLVSCNTNIPVSKSDNNFVSSIDNVISHTAITGKAEFPKLTPKIPLTPFAKGGNSVGAYNTKATLTEVGSYATVSIITTPDAPTPNKTIATGLTDDTGLFTINPAPGFNPATDDIFILEASKRIGSTGKDLITIRTYIKWTGSGWQSITKKFSNNTWPVFINTITTALVSIEILQTSISPVHTIGTIDVSTGSSVPTAVDIEPDANPEVTVAEINEVTGMINSLLGSDVDPTHFIRYETGAGKYTLIKVGPQKQFLIDTSQCHDCSLAGEDLAGLDLTGSDLSSGNLSSANLGSADLSDANLSSATMDGTVLTNATVTGTNFSNVNMTGIKGYNGLINDFSNYNFSNADLTGANFTGANLTGANFSGATITGANFTGATWVNGKTCDNGSLGLCLYEIQVNTYTISDQRKSSVAMDDDGDFVVTWVDYSQDGSGRGIYAQRYDNTGNAVGSEFRVNTYTTSNQSGPSVAMDSDGDFVVTWQSDGQDGSSYGIYAQRYDNTGNAVGSEFKINTYTTLYQSNPSVAIDSDGDFVVTWQSYNQDGIDYGIYAQRYDSNGNTVGNEFKVNTYTTSNQSGPSVAMDSDGDFVITWQSYSQDGSYFEVFAQRYNSSGVAQGNEFQVNTYTTNAQYKSSIAMDNDGDFVVSWLSYGQDNSYSGIFAQRYDSSGNTVGSEFQVNTYTTNHQASPAVAMDSNGDFVVTWIDYSQDGNGHGIFGQRYDSNGNAVDSEFQVNTFTYLSQRAPSVAMDSDGDFVVTWESYQDGSFYGIFSKRYKINP